MENQSSAKRDFLFLVALIIMVKVAMDRKMGPNNRPVLYGPAEQIRSMPLEMVENDTDDQTLNESDELAQNESKEDSVFVAHEPDQNIFEYIKEAQTQIQALKKITPATSKQSAQLESIAHRLVQLKNQYAKTSPGIALLGPIGTAGIIVKENELDKNLLKMVRMIRSILQLHLSDEQEDISYDSIAQGLEQNQLLLAQLSQASYQFSDQQ